LRRSNSAWWIISKAINNDRVYLLLLSGESEDANRFIAARFPGCENVQLSVRELREGGWRGQVRAFRKLKGKAFVVFSHSLEDVPEPQLIVWTGALHRCRFTVLADSRGRSMVSSRWTLIRALPLALTSALADLFVFGAAWCAIRGLGSAPASGPLRSRPAADVDLLYLYPFPFDRSVAGGALSHVTGFLGGLAATGARIEVFSGRPLPIHQFPVEVIPAKRRLFLFQESKRLSYNVRFARRVSKCLRGPRTGVLYQRHGRFVIAGALLSRLTRLPLILEYNGSEAWVADHWDPARFRRWLRLCEDFSLAHADLLVVVSEPLKQELLQRRIPEDRILLNPNAVDPNTFCPNALQSLQVREQLRFSASDIVVCFLGTFHYWHGTRVLEHAIGLLLKDGYPEEITNHLRFLLVGDGLLRAEMSKNLNRFVGGKVLFTGVVPHERVVEYLDAADILVSPHLPMPDGKPFFGSPTKIFEYMAMGKAIIASNLDQLSSVLTHQRNAWLVKPGDADELASAILLLAQNISLRKRLGQSAREAAVTKHTWQQNAERVLARIPYISKQSATGAARTRIA
jgi:glycosyltransferase involved in cell wall biosynthesis